MKSPYLIYFLLMVNVLLTGCIFDELMIGRSLTRDASLILKNNGMKLGSISCYRSAFKTIGYCNFGASSNEVRKLQKNAQLHSIDLSKDYDYYVSQEKEQRHSKKFHQDFMYLRFFSRYPKDSSCWKQITSRPDVDLSVYSMIEYLYRESNEELPRILQLKDQQLWSKFHLIFDHSREEGCVIVSYKSE